MFASAICVRAGAVSQAAFEIIRQAWIISIQVCVACARTAALECWRAQPAVLTLALS